MMGKTSGRYPRWSRETTVGCFAYCLLFPVKDMDCSGEVLAEDDETGGMR